MRRCLVMSDIDGTLVHYPSEFNQYGEIRPNHDPAHPTGIDFHYRVRDLRALAQRESKPSAGRGSRNLEFRGGAIVALHRVRRPVPAYADPRRCSPAFPRLPRNLPSDRTGDNESTPGTLDP